MTLALEGLRGDHPELAGRLYAHLLVVRAGDEGFPPSRWNEGPSPHAPRATVGAGQPVGFVDPPAGTGALAAGEPGQGG